MCVASLWLLMMASFGASVARLGSRQGPCLLVYVSSADSLPYSFVTQAGSICGTLAKGCSSVQLYSVLVLLTSFKSILVSQSGSPSLHRSTSLHSLHLCSEKTELQ